MRLEDLSYQQWLSIATGVIVAVLSAIAHVLRVRCVGRRIRENVEGQVAHELKGARELPDKLLQAIHGLVLRFHFASEQLEEAHPVRPMLKLTLQRADALLIDGRKQVQDLDSRVEAHEHASTRSNQ